MRKFFTGAAVAAMVCFAGSAQAYIMVNIGPLYCWSNDGSVSAMALENCERKDKADGGLKASCTLRTVEAGATKLYLGQVETTAIPNPNLPVRRTPIKFSYGTAFKCEVKTPQADVVYACNILAASGTCNMRREEDGHNVYYRVDAGVAPK